MRVELLEEPRQEGEDAILLLVLQMLELRDELLDARRVEPDLPLAPLRDVQTLGQGAQRLLLAFHLVTVAWEAVLEAQARLKPSSSHTC